jgi:hypothetical protein
MTDQTHIVNETGFRQDFARVTPFLSLAVPVILVTSLTFLRLADPTLFCAQMNAKESICGPEYTHAAVRFLRGLGLAAWVALVLISGLAILRNGSRRLASLSWIVSALLLAAFGVLWLVAPSDTCP